MTHDTYARTENVARLWAKSRVGWPFVGAPHAYEFVIPGAPERAVGISYTGRAVSKRRAAGRAE